MRTTGAKLLQGALDALGEGKPEAARTALVAAWRARRSARLARFVDLLDARWPDDVHARIASVVGPRAVDSEKRLQALADLDDPRLGRFAIDLLEGLPFTTPAALPFFVRLVDLVVRLRDERLHDRAQAITETMRVRLTRAPMRDELVERIARAVQKLRRPDAPDEKERTIEDAIEAKLAPIADGEANAERFLATIHANPDDDGARLVYADWLLERGDPRGELIALQFKRRDGGLSDEETAREALLLKKHGKAWLGALAPVISFGKGYARSTFDRGFLAVADIILSVGKKLEPIYEHPDWSTVEALEGNWPNDLLERAPLRALRRIDRSVTATQLHTLAARSEPLGAVQSIEIGELTGIDRTLLLRAFPNLRELVMVVPRPTNADVLAATAIGVPHTTIHPWAGIDPGAIERFEALIAEVMGTPAQVEHLALTPPFVRWPRGAPVVLKRIGDRYQRAP